MKNKRGVKTLKKVRILLAMLLAVSVFSFAGCGDNGDTAGQDAGNGTTVEETATDHAAEDLKDDVEDLGDDVKDGAEDLVECTDTKTDGTKADETKADETKETVK